MAEIARRTTKNNKRVMFLIHRKEVLNQAIETFRNQSVNPDLLTAGMVQTLTRRVDKLPIPDVILVDALTKIDTLGIPYISEIKGDAKEYSIAAASIIAKVTRDRIMRDWDEVYPVYGFAKHKGYGTAFHIQAIKENGLCKIHRRTFIKEDWIPKDK